MATKEQERKALEQIKKIVEGLGGQNSYIGMAFEGCFEIAESNIENDFGCSMKQRVEYTAEQLAEMKDSIECRERELADKEKEIRDLRESSKQQTDYVNELLDRNAKSNEVGMENLRLMLDYKAKSEEQETEIIKLKAKLYDLITQ